MVENHPELLKHARESHNRKAKLQEYKRLFGDNMKVYWEEIGKAQYLAKELSAYLDRVKSKTGQQTTSYGALLASPVAPSATEKKRVGWADTTTKAEPQPMNWSLVTKRQKTAEADDVGRGQERHRRGSSQGPGRAEEHCVVQPRVRGGGIVGPRNNRDD